MVKPRKIAALAALANKKNYAGKGPEEVELVIRQLMELEEDARSDFVSTGGIAIHFWNDGPAELYLYLGEVE